MLSLLTQENHAPYNNVFRRLDGSITEKKQQSDSTPLSPETYKAILKYRSSYKRCFSKEPNKIIGRYLHLNS